MKLLNAESKTVLEIYIQRTNYFINFFISYMCALCLCNWGPGRCRSGNQTQISKKAANSHNCWAVFAAHRLSGWLYFAHSTEDWLPSRTHPPPSPLHLGWSSLLLSAWFYGWCLNPQTSPLLWNQEVQSRTGKSVSLPVILWDSKLHLYLYGSGRGKQRRQTMHSAPLGKGSGEWQCLGLHPVRLQSKGGQEILG